MRTYIKNCFTNREQIFYDDSQFGEKTQRYINYLIQKYGKDNILYSNESEVRFRLLKIVKNLNKN